MKYKINLRRGEKWKVKPEAEILDGKIVEFEDTIENSNIIDFGSIYLGEKQVFINTDEIIKYNFDIPLWIASGDLVKEL